MPEINLPSNLTNSSIEIVGLKREFEIIGETFLFSICTRRTVDEMYESYFNLFNKYGLNDLQFKIETRGMIAEFIPIRNIDKMAIFGILNTPGEIKITMSEDIKNNYINILKKIKQR